MCSCHGHVWFMSWSCMGNGRFMYSLCTNRDKTYDKVKIIL